MQYRTKKTLGAFFGCALALAATVGCYFLLAWCSTEKEIPFPLLFPIVIGLMVVSLGLSAILHRLFLLKDNTLYGYLLLIYGVLWFVLAYVGLENFGDIVGEPMPLPLSFWQGAQAEAATLTFVYSWFWFGYTLIYSPPYRSAFKWMGIVLFFPAFLIYNACRNTSCARGEKAWRYVRDKKDQQ